ncbi:MAG: hypothetical protein ACFB03_08735 [Paracoccaceae bacterium]
MIKLAGKRAAATKRAKYGQEGLSAIARKAYETQKARQDERLSGLERHVVRSATSAKRRASSRGLDCEDDLKTWALAALDAQKARCALSGVPFDLEIHGHGAAPRPYAPSIDRKDATKGYTADNIRLICWAANLFLGTWGDGAAFRIAQGMVKYRG